MELMKRKNESVVTDKEKIIVLGSGPIRIGQGVEFDYATVHSVWAIKEMGLRSHHYQQQPGNSFYRLLYLGQIILRTINRGRCNEYYRP